MAMGDNKPSNESCASLSSSSTDQQQGSSSGLIQFSSAQFNPLLFNVSPSNFRIAPNPVMSPLASTGSRDPDHYQYFADMQRGLDQFSRSQFNPLLFNVSPSPFKIVPTQETTLQASRSSVGLNQFCTDQQRASSSVNQFSSAQFNPLLFNVTPSNFPTVPTPEVTPQASTTTGGLDQFSTDQQRASSGLDQFSSAQYNPLLFNVSMSTFPKISNPAGSVEFSDRPHHLFPDLESAYKGQLMFMDYNPYLMPRERNSPFRLPLSVFMPPSDSGPLKDDDRPILPPSMMVTYAEQEKAKQMENSEKYRRLIGATEGFCAGKWKESDLSLIFNGIERRPINTPNACSVAEFAVSFLNKEGGEEIKVKRIIRLNGQVLKRLRYFMTLEASDNKFYEAKVYLGIDEPTKELEFIRPAKYFPKLPDNLRHLVGPDEGTSSCH